MVFPAREHWDHRSVDALAEQAEVIRQLRVVRPAAESIAVIRADFHGVNARAPFPRIGYIVALAHGASAPRLPYGPLLVEIGRLLPRPRGDAQGHLVGALPLRLRLFRQPVLLVEKIPLVVPFGDPQGPAVSDGIHARQVDAGSPVLVREELDRLVAGKRPPQRVIGRPSFGRALDERAGKGRGHDEVVVRRADGGHGADVRESHGRETLPTWIADRNRPANEWFGIVQPTFNRHSHVARWSQSEKLDDDLLTSGDRRHLDRSLLRSLAFEGGCAAFGLRNLQRKQRLTGRPSDHICPRWLMHELLKRRDRLGGKDEPHVGILHNHGVALRGKNGRGTECTHQTNKVTASHGRFSLNPE